MLAQRVATALVLLALWLPTLWMHDPWPFMGLTLILVSAAAWEWARLNGVVAGGAWGIVVVLVLTCLLLALTPAFGETGAAWWFAAAAWLVGGISVLRLGPDGWGRLPRLPRVVVGLLMLGVAWWALAQARIVGVNYLLSVLCVVWMADIAAYFGGRAIGGPKLAPSISPGKSWAGVWSGMAGVLLLGAVWWGLIDRHVGVDSASLYGRLADRFGLAPAALALLFLAAMSVIGDLVESLVKRSAGAKDSSTLLPGHGGVLDRIDALLPVFPLALALALS